MSNSHSNRIEALRHEMSTVMRLTSVSGVSTVISGFRVFRTGLLILTQELEALLAATDRFITIIFHLNNAPCYLL